MSRLTDTEYGAYCAYANTIDCNDCNSCKWSQAIYDKLAHYEDLEEQGRLVILPCLPMEAVWVADGKLPTHRGAYVCQSHILSDLEDGCGIGYTKAEAEVKLAELKEGGSDE